MANEIIFKNVGLDLSHVRFLFMIAFEQEMAHKWQFKRREIKKVNVHNKDVRSFCFNFVTKDSVEVDGTVTVLDKNAMLHYSVRESTVCLLTNLELNEILSELENRVREIF